MANESIQVLVADDHPTTRTGVRTLLELSGGIEVIGEAESTDEAIRLAAERQPDVVMMDMRIPTVGGVEATRMIVRESPHMAVLVFTMVEDDDVVFAALRAGARGYIVKEAGPTELIRAVQAVAQGEAIFSSAIAKLVSSFFAAAGMSSPVPEAFPVLTVREREILNLIAAGHNNTELARRLTLSPKTVRNHISNIFAKLHVADRAQAMVRAREAGLGRGPHTIGGTR